jgi:hypothetical protein
MKIQTASALGSLVAVSSLLLTGCLSELTLDEELAMAQLERTTQNAPTQNAPTQNALTQNALTQNALTQNALTQNALTQNALTQNALTQNALTQNALTSGALTDPSSLQLLKYVVSCALAEDQQLNLTIDGVAYSFPGQLGLASGWGLTGGRCDDKCQATVSSCVLARVNYLGVPVDISLRGNSKLKTSAAERVAYPNAEAAYYGNIFTSPQKRYACTAPGSTLISRVCGPDYLAGCVMTIVGDCEEACDSVDSKDGYFKKCHDSVRLSEDEYPAGTESFKNAVTVFRQ